MASPSAPKREDMRGESPPPEYGSIEQPPPPPPAGAAPSPTTINTTSSVPPGYGEGGYPDEPPPSYFALYGHVKDIRHQSSGPLDFFKKFLSFLLGTLACSIFVGIVLAIPISMIVIGAMYKDDCRGQKYIPLYLIVGGAFGIIKNLVNLGHRYRHSQQEGASDEEHVKQNPMDGLLNCFLLAWFIAGCVWVYGLDPNVHDVTNPDYCHPVVYYFAFWLLTIVYIFLLATCCCLCCAGVAGYKFAEGSASATVNNS